MIGFTISLHTLCKDTCTTCTVEPDTLWKSICILSKYL